MAPESGGENEDVMLTRKQRELLKFIQEKLAETGISPSFDEMKEALGLKSKSGVHRLITGLEERGFIKRLPHRARALDVVRLPEDQTAKAAAQVVRPAVGDDRRASLNVIRGDFTPSIPGAVVTAQSSSALQLPLYGKIAAGTPIEALRDNSNAVDVPATLLGRGEHYALTVEGDSMVDAGIHDGDTVVIETDQLYQRSIDDEAIRPIPGTAGARNLFLSPDGRWAGFVVQADGPVDHRLPILTARDSQGKLFALLANYACHCTTLGGDFNQICGDWAGYAQAMIEERHPGAVALVQAQARLEFVRAQLERRITRAELAPEASRLGLSPADPGQVVALPAEYLAVDAAAESNADDASLLGLAERASRALVPEATARARAGN